MGTSPQEFDVFFKSEVKKWAKVVDEAHVRVD
jgi:hypothetical protein